ncbi:MAG: hypothetical protein IKV19_03235 [Bacteroidaceae bacterium]|nr:hypothetical protein [Bacteroidaceae bacterium]
MGVIDFITLMALYIEVGVLAYFDYKLWRSIYTPLNMLMLPYTFVLTITILCCGNMGLVDFYYPSLQVWMVGLLVFAVPSYLFGLSFRKNTPVDQAGNIDDNIDMRVLNILSTVLVVAFLLRFVSMLGSSPYLPGSEDFGYAYCGGGLWGHLHRTLNALSIIYIYKFDKKHWYYLLLVFGMFFVTLMYGVKSWVLIPAVAGICMRLYAGKLKLSPMLVLKISAAAFLVFIVTYSLSLLVGTDDSNEVSDVFAFICRVFVHYLISGVLGWSQDLQMGILEQPNFDALIANVLNFYHVLAGSEYVQVINPFFIHNGVNGSNVRSFFGTIYINSNTIQFIGIVTYVSSLLYMAKVLVVYYKGIFLNVAYFFLMAMLIMGWFDYYFYTLTALEVPAWVFILYLIARKRNKDGDLPSSLTDRKVEQNV